MPFVLVQTNDSHLNSLFFPPSKQDILLKKEYPQQNLLIGNDIIKADDVPKQGSDFWLKAGDYLLPFISTSQLIAWLEILVVMVVGVTKQEKCSKNRFDDVETRTFQINGTVDGEALQGIPKQS